MSAATLPLHTDTFAAMGTEIRVLVCGREAPARSAMVAVRALFTRNEARFSRFRPESELSALNRAAGDPFSCSDALYRLVALAFDYRERTQGLFDPTLLHHLMAAGYDRSFDRLPPSRATGQARRPASAAPSRRASPFLDARSRTITMPVGAALDLGGIAKGWTVDEARSLMPADRPYLIDAGGDIYANGAGPDGSGWIVAVADPMRPDEDAARLRVADCAVATSAVTRRRWLIDGQVRHHLIDPRTGRPVENELASVTVIGPSVSEAEVWAKAILIGGLERVDPLLERSAGCAALLIAKDGGLVWSEGMARYRVDA
jgi:thiamine biosynthesis lipoprotein